jgi:ABC-type glycerol-3-phosphate transport system permease component
VSTDAKVTRGTVVSPAPGGRPPRTVRRARVAVTKIDPWSVMKLAFALSIGLAVVILVTTALLWAVLSSAGVFDQITATVQKVSDDAAAAQFATYLGFGRVMAVAFIVAMIDIVLMTALATLTAFLFNLATGVVGGVDVTLTESD